MGMIVEVMGSMLSMLMSSPVAAEVARATSSDRSGAPTLSRVVELRRYTLHPFKRDVLIDLFEHEFVESQEAEGMRVIGTFRDLDAPERFVWLRGFTDMQARTRALSAFYQGSVWRMHRDAANRTMIDSDDVLLLRPVWAAADFDDATVPLRPRNAVATPAGIVVAHLHYLQAKHFAAIVGAFRDEAMEILREAGIDVVAVLATESAPNGFPSLPVREGEHVLGWLARYPDLEAAARAENALSSNPAWRRVDAALHDGSKAPTEVLRLLPTARSRLPGGR